MKAIIFDLDGTLYRQDTLRRAMLVRLVRAHALRPITAIRTARVLGAYRRAQEQLRERSTGTANLAQAQIQLACESSGADAAFVSDCVSRWMEEDPLAILHLHLRPGLIDFLRVCRQKQLRLGVLSDYPAEAKLQALGLADLFDVARAAQSPDVGVFKPHPHGLLTVAHRLGVQPAECVYVGDRPEVDAPAAKAAGMDCYIITRRRRPASAGWTQVADFRALHNALFEYQSAAQRLAAQPLLDRR